ncbi:TPA: glycosyltransferase [Vibrio parahaemolyticus]|nr:glycosyltransferase [Vibrio parahaemolyticus]HCG7214103.1 glycosyltransferase [Vibrio parahaemolyticus]
MFFAGNEFIMEKKVAVITSVYKSDTYPFVKQAIESLINQTYTNIDIFIQVDGWVPDDVNQLLIGYGFHNNIHVYFHRENKGLAARLNNSIDHVVRLGIYDYVARMDTDDISCSNRIKTQVDFLNSHENIDVVGSDVIEISGTGQTKFYKKMDSEHDMMKKMIIKKCPFNHPSVMFRVNVFEEGFRYNASLMNTQDYYLWVDLLFAGKRFSNINEPLLMFRVNDDFHTRRGLKKAINDLNARLYAFKKLNVTSLGNITHTLLLFFLRLSPSIVKKMAYKLLR